MATLFDLIRKLVLLAIFAGFCELLLPKGTFRGYTRMVVGLLVLAMILQPMLELRGADFDLDGILGLMNLNASTPTIAHEGQSQQARQLVEEQLAIQAQEFFAEDYPDTEVLVSMDIEVDEYGIITELHSVQVDIYTKVHGIQPVKPVSIGGDESATEEKVSLEPSTVNALARYLGIPANKLTIWDHTSGGESGAR